MEKTIKKTMAILGVVLLLSTNALFAQQTKEQLATGIAKLSQFIFEGKIIKKNEVFRRGDKAIFTSYTVKVTTVIYGTVKTGEIELVSSGGTMPDDVDENGAIRSETTTHGTSELFPSDNDVIFFAGTFKGRKGIAYQNLGTVYIDGNGNVSQNDPNYEVFKTKYELYKSLSKIIPITVPEKKSPVSTPIQKISISPEEQKQDEQGAALKKWYDSWDIIIDATVEDAKNNSSNSDDFLCNLVKINQVLKGNLNKGYVNVISNGHVFTSPDELIDPSSSGGGFVTLTKGKRYIIKINKSSITGNRFSVSNNGTYRAGGDYVNIEDGTLFTFYEVPNTSGYATKIYKFADLSRSFKEYCNVTLNIIEKKSPSTTQQQINNELLYQQKVKKHIELHQFAQNQLQQRNALPNSVSTTTQCTDLFISEYLDGQGNNNAVEIYNPTNAAISLSNYSLLIYHGASYTPITIALTGTISAQATHVISKPNASSAILAHTNQTSNNLNFNGDEIIVLSKATAGSHSQC